MRHNPIVATAVALLYHPILVLSLYFLFAGHNQPGGGFVGGLLVGTALALRYVAAGSDALAAALPVPPNILLGGGLAVATLTAAVPLVLGHQVLEHALFEADLPLLGVVKATSALPFDIGVYLLVIGAAALGIESFLTDEEAS